MRKILAASAAALMGMAVSPARAADPLLTDPSGDATGPANVLQPLFVPPLPSDASVDIVSADVQVADGILRLTTSVVDLVAEAPAHFDGRRFLMSVYHGQGHLVVDGDIAPTYEAYRGVYYGTGNGSAPVTVAGTYDVVADTVTFAIDVDHLNEAADTASNGRDDHIRAGSRLHGLVAQTYYSPFVATPFGGYYLGLISTDIGASEDDAVYEVPGG